MSMFEISLVPDVKRQLLHTASNRKVITFICILVVAISGGVILLLLSALGVQTIAMNGNADRIGELYTQISTGQDLSVKTPEYLSTILTLQNQLTKVDEIITDKKVTSRIFPALDMILPAGMYKVTLSSMGINFDTGIINLDGQASSTTGNDYAALQALEETIIRTRIDYGRYTDKDGNALPTVDITEDTVDGRIVGIYQKTECFKENDPEFGRPTEDPSDSNGEDDSDTTTGVTTSSTGIICRPVGKPISILRYATEDEINRQEGYRFTSACNARVDIVNGRQVGPIESICDFAQPLAVTDRSSGRNAQTNEVVLRFSSRLTPNRELFSFRNKHMLVLGVDRQNVTASYVQIRDMFEEEALDCAPDDYECLNAAGGL